MALIKPEQADYQNIIILRATISDSYNVWQWRNDPVTKTMSISNDDISWEEHSNWYVKSLTNPNLYLYIGYLNDNKKIGMCRFDIEINTKIAAVSINLNPDCRNKNLSTPLLISAIKIFQNEADIALTAKIKKINISSIKCFTKAGFIFEYDDLNCNYYRYYP